MGSTEITSGTEKTSPNSLSFSNEIAKEVYENTRKDLGITEIKNKALTNIYEQENIQVAGRMENFLDIGDFWEKNKDTIVKNYIEKNKNTIKLSNEELEKVLGRIIVDFNKESYNISSEIMKEIDQLDKKKLDFKEKWEEVVKNAFDKVQKNITDKFEKHKLPVPNEVIVFFEDIKKAQKIPTFEELGFGKKPQKEKKQDPNKTPIADTEKLPDPKTIAYKDLKTKDNYVNAIAGKIAHQPEDYQYLKEKDPQFYGILQILWGEKKDISMEEYRVLQQKIHDPANTQYAENLSKIVENNNKKFDKADLTKDEQEKQMTAITKPLVHIDSDGMPTYQLAMASIASIINEKIDAKQITLNLDKNRAEKDESKIKDEIIKSSEGKGYTVAYPNTKIDSNLLNAERGGKLTIGNLLLDQIVRSWGMMVILANGMAAFKDGGWMDRSLLFGMGGFAMYGAAYGVLNSGINKAIDPSNIPTHIMTESMSNTYYQEYFGNEYEIAFAKQMKVPKGKDEKKTFLDALKGISKEKTAKTKEIGEKLSKEDQKKFKDQEKDTLCANDFETNADLKQFFPNNEYQLPNGKYVSRAEFLKTLDDPKKGVSAKARFETMKNMIERLPDDEKRTRNDSYFAHLEKLHALALKNQSKQATRNQVDNVEQAINFLNNDNTK